MARQGGTSDGRTIGGIRNAVREARERANAAAARAEEAEQQGDTEAAADAWAEAEAANDEETTLRDEYTAVTGRELDGDGNPGGLNVELQRQAGHARLEGTSAFAGMTKLEMLETLGLDRSELDGLTADDVDAVADQVLEHDAQLRDEGVRDSGRRYVEEVLDVDVSQLTDDEVAELIEANQGAFDAAHARAHDNLTEEGLEEIGNDPDVPPAIRDAFTERAKKVLDTDHTTVVPDHLSGRVIDEAPDRPSGGDLIDRLKRFAREQIAEVESRRESDEMNPRATPPGQPPPTHRSPSGEDSDGDAAIEKATTNDIQKWFDDTGITKAAQEVRSSLEELARAADEAGRTAVEDAAQAAQDAADAAAAAAEDAIDAVTTAVRDAAANAELAADDVARAVRDGLDGAGIAAQEAIDAAAEAARNAAKELESAVRQGLEEGGALADQLRDELDRAIGDATAGVSDALDRLGETADALLNDLAEGAADLLGKTSGIGSYSLGFEWKIDRTPPTPGETPTTPGATDDRMNPGGQAPTTPHDGRSGGDRLRDSNTDRINDRRDGGDPTKGGSTTSTTTTPAPDGSGGLPGTGSGGGGGGGGGGAGGADVMPTPTPSTGAGGTGSESGSAAGSSGVAAGSAASRTPSESGESTASENPFHWKLEGQWLDSDNNPVDSEAAERLEASYAAQLAAEAAAAAEASNDTDLETSGDRLDPGPTGIDTGRGRMVDEMVQQHRDVIEAGRAGSRINPVREGIEVGHMSLDDLPNRRDLQQPPAGEDFTDGEPLGDRGPDYSSSTGAGVINDPNMTFGPDGPTLDPAGLDLDRPEDLSHLADGITGGTATDTTASAGGMRPAGPLPTGVDPADLRIGEPIDLGRAVPGSFPQPSFGTGARGEQYTTAPLDPGFGTGDSGTSSDTSSDSTAAPSGSSSDTSSEAGGGTTVDFSGEYTAIDIGGGGSSGPTEPAPEPEPESYVEAEPVTFEPAPTHAIGDPVAGTGTGTSGGTTSGVTDWTTGQSSGSPLDRGVGGFVESGRLDRLAPAEDPDAGLDG